MRRDSWRSVPRMCRPPSLAHLVALVLARVLVLLDELRRTPRARPRGSRFCSLNSSLREHLRVAAEDDVGAATGHVGRDGDGALAARLRDDERLVLVVLGVEDRVLDLLLLQDARDRRALLDAGRADEDGLPALVVLEDLVDDRGELLALGLVDEVLVVVADDGLVRRDDDDVELVRRVELGGLGVGRAGHARELLVDAEEVLEGDRRHRAALFLDAHVLLRLDRLVQPVAPAAARRARGR